MSKWQQIKKINKVSMGIFSIICLCLMTTFWLANIRLKTALKSLWKPPVIDPLTLVVFLESFEDVQHPESRSTFGWGAIAKIEKAAAQLSAEVNNCGQFLTVPDAPLRLDVKIDSVKSAFRVVGILSGASENPAKAQCVRNKINSAQPELLSELKAVDGGLYRIILGIHASGAAPLSEMKE